MGKILHLSNLVINQIAAGEIIERPSSVIKELLENSIDSGANTISLHINEGGMEKVEVCDNGEGMRYEDLPLSIARHATSKIKYISDLNKCVTHGFRGEALAAISSVSKLKIISRSNNDDNGYILEKIDDDWACSPSPAKKGTTVIVEELFYKIPARKKFLKSVGTEFTHSKNSFLKTCLIHNDINWHFYSNGKELIKMPAKKIYERFANFCDVPIETIHHTKKNVGPIVIEICFPFSDSEKRKKNNQFVYVNNRAVTNRTLFHAINAAVDEIMHGNKNLSIFLSLKVPNELVDFNVHPCKNEVRFKDNSAIYEVVITTLKNSFKNFAGQQYINQIVGLNPPMTLDTNSQRVRKRSLPNKDNTNQSQLSIESIKKISKKENPGSSHLNNFFEKTPPLGYALSQLHGIYVLAENADGLIIVDIHAAHERILFEEYKKNIQTHKLKIQKLITPTILLLNEEEMEAFTNNISLFNTLGFDVSKKNSTSISIEGIPELSHNIEISNTILEIIEDLLKFGQPENFDANLMKYLGNLACKSAIKANRKMTIPEMNSLLRSMEKTDFGGKCNHGRPSWAQLNIDSIDKIFFRGR